MAEIKTTVRENTPAGVVNATEQSSDEDKNDPTVGLPFFKGMFSCMYSYHPEKYLQAIK